MLTHHVNQLKTLATFSPSLPIMQSKFLLREEGRSGTIMLTHRVNQLKLELYNRSYQYYLPRSPEVSQTADLMKGKRTKSKSIVDKRLFKF